MNIRDHIAVIYFFAVLNAFSHFFLNVGEGYMMEQQLLRSRFMETSTAVPALLDMLAEPWYFLLNFSL